MAPYQVAFEPILNQAVILPLATSCSHLAPEDIAQNGSSSQA